MRSMRKRVIEYDVDRWAKEFLAVFLADPQSGVSSRAAGRLGGSRAP